MAIQRRSQNLCFHSAPKPRDIPKPESFWRFPPHTPTGTLSHGAPLGSFEGPLDPILKIKMYLPWALGDFTPGAPTGPFSPEPHQGLCVGPWKLPTKARTWFRATLKFFCPWHCFSPSIYSIPLLFFKIVSPPFVWSRAKLTAPPEKNNPVQPWCANTLTVYVLKTYDLIASHCLKHQFHFNENQSYSRRHAQFFLQVH